MESNQHSLTWLVTGAAGFLLLLYSRTIIQGISGLAELFQPFLMGVVIAFILSRPYELFQQLYQKKLHFKVKTAHILGIVSAYLAIFAVLAAVIGVVIPQLASSIRLFAQNAEYYLENLQLQDAGKLLCRCCINSRNPSPALLGADGLAYHNQRQNG